MSSTLIHDVRYPLPAASGGGMAQGDVLLDGDRIVALGRIQSDAGATNRIAGQGALLTPGLIDLHTHGVDRYLYESGPEALLAGLAILPRFGTTCVLPTVYHVVDGASSVKHLEPLAAALTSAENVFVPGLHLEGPFLAIPGAGAQTLPGDVKLLDDLLAACHDRVAAMSISPEQPNIIPVIERLVSRGVVPLITHTRASVRQTQAAIDAGARHATHFYDVFPSPDETEPGVRPVGAVETILANRHVSVDFIADGVHVDPMAIRAALAAKGFGGVIAVTDSNVGAGLPAGEYDMVSGLRIRTSATDAARIVTPTSKAGQLAGSTLTMDRAVANLLQWLDLPPDQVWAMGTENPARLLGLADRGVIRVGAMADLVLWDNAGHADKTWVGGRLVFDAAAPRHEPRGEQLIHG